MPHPADGWGAHTTVGGKLIWQPPVYPEAQECKVRCMWWCTATCNGGCFYCVVKNQLRERRKSGARWWNIQDVSAAWGRIYQRYGPWYIEMAGGEATTVPDVIRAVWDEGHYLQVLTNLRTDPLTLADMAGERLMFPVSFHPHLWDFEVDRFIDQVKRYQDLNLHIMGVSVVAHPVYLPMLDGWLDRMRENGLYVAPSPFSGYYEGKPYEESYLPEEYAKIVGDIPNPDRNRWLDDLEFRSHFHRCAAGWKYVIIDVNGDVRPCMVTGEGGVIANIFRDDECIGNKPINCQEAGRCSCEQYDVLRIHDDAIVESVTR